MKPSDNIIKYTTGELIDSEGYTDWVSANTDTSKNTVDDISPAPYQDGWKYTFSWVKGDHSGVFSLLCNDDKTEWQTQDKNPFENISSFNVECRYENGYPSRIVNLRPLQSDVDMIILDSNPSNYTIGETYTGENDYVFEITSIEENIVTETLYEVTLYYNSETTYLPKSIFDISKGKTSKIKTFEIHSDIINSLEDGIDTGRGYQSVFALTPLQSLIIDTENLEKIGDYSLYNCNDFTELTLYSTSIPTIGTDAFYLRTPTDRTLYVPESVLEDYQNSDFANYFTSILPIPTPPIPPQSYGFNFEGMIDTDYMREI